jgi:hypothetical protein
MERRWLFLARTYEFTERLNETASHWAGPFLFGKDQRDSRRAVQTPKQFPFSI